MPGGPYGFLCCFGGNRASSNNSPMVSKGGDAKGSVLRAQSSRREEQASLEEVKQWGQSFDAILRSPGGQSAFRKHLRSEYSEENIMFWLACEDLKKETHADVIKSRVNEIYHDFISTQSPHEINISGDIRRSIEEKLPDPPRTIFVEAQFEIYRLMNEDSYRRFIASQPYKLLLDRATKRAQKNLLG